jgi:hypothetical protein
MKISSNEETKSRVKERGDFMKTFFKPVGLLLITIIPFLPLVISTEIPENQKSKAKAQGPSKTMPQVARGRYLVMNLLKLYRGKIGYASHKG